MFIDFMLDRAKTKQADRAIVWNQTTFTYEWLIDQVSHARSFLNANHVKAGDIISLKADFSPYTVAIFLALIEHGCILVPLHESLPSSQAAEFLAIAQVEKSIGIMDHEWQLTTILDQTADHELYDHLKRTGQPGLVLFSSGTTGKSKAMVHNLVPFLQKFKVNRQAYTMIAFMQFDHIGGINTMLYALSSLSCLIMLKERTPHEVCELIELHRVDLLPTSPTFINLLLLSGAYRAYDLRSLHTITYGSEVMNESTLNALLEALPQVKLMQTYGLSEVGILRSKSISSNSLWVKVGGDGVDIRVRNGMLEIRTLSAMLGYLNAPSPFTEDGWFMTGDMVELKDDYIRILGRQSEIINIGGEKVFPAEIEGVLQKMYGVLEVAVSSEANAITGQVVKATVLLATDEDLPAFRRRMREFCHNELAVHKIPQKVVIQTSRLYNDRFKKIR